VAQLPRAVLLDLDDTILDDSGGIASCWREACLACHGDMGEIDPSSVYDAIERTREWFWADPERHRRGRLDLATARQEVALLALASIGVERPDLARRIGDRYHTLRDLGLRPVAGAVAMVQWLRDRGCRLALLTNGSSELQRAKISRFSLAGLFDEVLIEGEVGFGKPDPRIYEMALGALGVAPTEAWMVGDNLEWDVAAPQRQGIYGIWIDVRGSGLPAAHPVRPDRIVRHLSELRDPDD
jgi:putative hydrolase of the HAD superfamily